MDLGSKRFDVRAAAEKGAWLQLLHPATDEELGVAEGRPCRIEILGADSSSYEEAVARSVALKAKEQAPTAAKKRVVTAEKVLESAERNNEFVSEELAAITLGWEHIEWNGEPLEFNHENAVMLYMEHKWIREQTAAFFSDRTNYLGKE